MDGDLSSFVNLFPCGGWVISRYVLIPGKARLILKDSSTRLHGHESKFYLLLALWAWAIYIISLCLSFLICKMKRIIIVSHHKVVVSIKLDNICEMLKTKLLF